MTRVTCRLTAKNRDQLWNRTVGNRVWANFFNLRIGAEFRRLRIFDSHTLTVAQLRTKLRCHQCICHSTKSTSFRRQQNQPRQAALMRLSYLPLPLSSLICYTVYTYGESDIISMPVGFRRHVVGKTLRNDFHCVIAEIRFVGKLVIIGTFS